MTTRIRMRRGSKHGSKHIQLGINNQDACLSESFTIAAWQKQYNVGIVCDGCTGFPAFSRTEVGSNLLALFAFTRIQEFICGGSKLQEIPRALFQACAEFLRDLTNKMMPATISWQYPVALPKRENWTSVQRFRADYLSATLLGYICDGETLITFSSGDGIFCVDDNYDPIEQDDEPDYLAGSINKPGAGFTEYFYLCKQVKEVIVATDGLKKLMENPEFRGKMFTNMADDPSGLQYLLNVTHKKQPELMQDDCTAVTWQQLQ